MGKEYAGPAAVGVATVKELRYRNPESWPSHCRAEQEAKAGSLPPSENLVTRWIEHAKKLPQKITYR